MRMPGVEAARPANRSKEAKASLLLTLHQQLVQHQKSVDEAFSSLDTACCTLAATLARLPNAAVAAGEEKAPTPSMVLGFTELLHRIEIFHDFLFTNLYAHQRDVVLRVVGEVERCFLPDAALPERWGALDASPLNPQPSLCPSDAELRVLRHHIAQLRYSLSLPVSAHGIRRLPPPPPPPTASRALVGTAAASVTPFVEHLQHHNTGPIASSELSGQMSGFTFTQSAVRPLAHGVSRGATSSPRLFAVSASFLRQDASVQQTLVAVLGAVQRWLSVYPVVLGHTTGLHAEVDVSLQLGCLFLVAPHRLLPNFPSHPAMMIVSDRMVLGYLKRHGRGPTPAFSSASRIPSTSDTDPEDDMCAGDDEDVSGEHSMHASALHKLFDSLELHIPGTEETGLELPSPSPVLPACLPVQDTVVVQRSALRRCGGLRQGEFWKRPRPQHDDDEDNDGTHLKIAPSAASSMRADPYSPPLSAPVVPATATALENSGAEGGSPGGAPFYPPSVREVGSLWLNDEGALPQRASGMIEPDITPAPAPTESQHIGLTQHTSAMCSSSTRLSPARPSSGYDLEGEALAPPSTPSRPVFQISNSVRYLKAQLVDAIEQLGGVVEHASGYRQECCYLIVAEGITERTEKYLGACAAAIPIVPPRFVFDSQRRGYWLAHRAHEYDISPQRVVSHRPSATPVFKNWRVVLITSRTAAARGVRTALLAGGCTNATAFVVHVAAEETIDAVERSRVYDAACATEGGGVVEGLPPFGIISADLLTSATHILVECSNITAHGSFQLPSWVPPCVRESNLLPRIFTLELLFFCLCSHPERVFDTEGRLCDADALTSACRVDTL